jgi:decaprenylphospho-beta-D-ribofuranose 2-oxidase
MKSYSGWGRNISSESRDCVLGDLDSKRDDRGYLAVGMRRSYGDSSLNSGGTVIQLQNTSAIVIDSSVGVAECDAGVTIGELERVSLERGFFPVVVPGTQFVSMGGAIASDIHGKSHHLDGAFSKNVSSLSIRLASGESVVLDPKDARFAATVGGMGLTGVVTSVTTKLRKVETSYVVTENKRVADLDYMLSALIEMDKKFPYTVAWIDLSGDFRGRGIVSGGRHALKSDLPNRILNRPIVHLNRPALKVPDLFPNGLINSSSVRAFNALWFQKPTGGGFENVNTFMHPLDGIGHWNRLYGRDGFVQYQFVIPFDQSWFIKYVLQEMKSLGLASFLSVLKSFGDESSGLLSFPKPGWSLAIDIPTYVEGLSKCLDRLDDKLVEAGGRIYLTKDSRMRSEHVGVMYPDLDKWRQIREQMDPDHKWQSDQARRLRLCEMD